MIPVLQEVTSTKLYTLQGGILTTLEYHPDRNQISIDNGSIHFVYNDNKLPTNFAGTGSSLCIIRDITKDFIYFDIVHTLYNKIHSVPITVKNYAETTNIKIGTYQNNFCIYALYDPKPERFFSFCPYPLAYTRTDSDMRIPYTKDVWDISDIEQGGEVFFEGYPTGNKPCRFQIEYPTGHIIYDSYWLGDRTEINSNPKLYPDGWIVDERDHTVPICTKIAGEDTCTIHIYTPYFDATTWEYTLTTNLPYLDPDTLYPPGVDIPFTPPKSYCYMVNIKNSIVYEEEFIQDNRPYVHNKDQTFIPISYFPNVLGGYALLTRNKFDLYTTNDCYNIYTQTKVKYTDILSFPDYFIYNDIFTRIDYYRTDSLIHLKTNYCLHNMVNIWNSICDMESELPFTISVDNVPISVYLVDSIDVQYPTNKHLTLHFHRAVTNFRVLPLVHNQTTPLYVPYVNVGDILTIELPPNPVSQTSPDMCLQVVYNG